MVFKTTLGASLIAAAGLAVADIPRSGAPDVRVARKIVQPTKIAHPPAQHVFWNPSLEKQSPFGFIPTEWAVRPQLLPGHWDAKTIFASGDADGKRGFKRTSR